MTTSLPFYFMGIDLSTLGSTVTRHIDPFNQLFSIASNNKYPFDMRYYALSYMSLSFHKSRDEKIIECCYSILLNNIYSIEDRCYLLYQFNDSITERLIRFIFKNLFNDISTY